MDEILLKVANALSLNDGTMITFSQKSQGMGGLAYHVNIFSRDEKGRKTVMARSGPSTSIKVAKTSLLRAMVNRAQKALEVVPREIMNE